MSYYNEIKNELINNEVYKKVKDYSKNKNDLTTYYNVGKLLFEAGKHYGEGIIKKYSIKLINEGFNKYNTTTLKRMRQFYCIVQKGAPLGHQLTWSHYRELLPLKNIDAIKYYIRKCENNCLTKRELIERIKNNEYERLPEEYKEKFVCNEKPSINDYIPSPILIHNKNNIEVVNEKILHRLILEDISSFMKELGNGYSFIDSEYKIKVGNRYNYIDLLLFNYDFNCFVVIELKVVPLKKEHIGQIEVYMNYIDKCLKKSYMSSTIGIIICKKDNKFVIEYTSNPNIISRDYKLIGCII